MVVVLVLLLGCHNLIHDGHAVGCSCPTDSGHSTGILTLPQRNIPSSPPRRSSSNSRGRSHHTGVSAPGDNLRILNINYTTCTDFGDNPVADFTFSTYSRNRATSCCNFCCDRTDPLPFHYTAIEENTESKSF